jgi:hypothetical protein
MAETLKPISMGPFLGMNNRLPDTQLVTKDGTYLRNAVNVDVGSGGFVKRRRGSTLIFSGTDCHSFWSTVDNYPAWYVDYNVLYQVNGVLGAITRTPTITGLTPGMPMSYAYLNGDLYCTNGVQINRITNFISYPAAVPTPQMPTATVSTGGALKSGLYSFTVTFQSAEGEESGAPFPVQLTVPEGGTITFTNIAQSIYQTNIYLTPLNGDEYYLAASVPMGVTSYTVSNRQAFGRLCKNIGLIPMPPGQIIRILNGRIFVASGNILYYSETYSPLYNPQRNYVPFPNRITLVEDVNNGLYICADQTYWVKGDILDAELNPVLPYGAVEGTGGYITNENAAFWMSPRGLVKGTQDGVVTNLQEATNVVNSGIIGASLFRESDGLKQMLTTLFGSPPSTVIAADSWMSADVVRKGTTL